MFTPRSTIRPVSHENANVMRRKDEPTKSVRKAFADRCVNQNQPHKNAQKQFPVSQPETTCKPAESPKSQYPSYLGDVCSYKEVDIEDWGITAVVPRFERQLTSTPPPKYYVPLLESTEIADNHDFIFEMIAHDDSFSRSNQDEIEEPKIPEISFNDFSF